MAKAMEELEFAGLVATLNQAQSSQCVEREREAKAKKQENPMWGNFESPDPRRVAVDSEWATG